MRFADYEMEKAVLGCMIADRSAIIQPKTAFSIS